MNDVVNLNRFRKRMARDAEASAAAENRARFGQTKAERDLVRQRETRAQLDHQQHHLEHDLQQRKLADQAPTKSEDEA